MNHIFRIMNIQVIASVILAAAFVACAPASQSETAVQPADLSDVLSIPQLASLDSLTLGMDAQALQSVRPHVGLMPYVGMYEEMDADTVYYHFPEGAPANVLDEISINGRAPDAGSPLLAVEVYTRHPSTAAADSIWEHRTALLARSETIGSVKADSIACFSYMHGPVSSLGMLLKVEEDWVGSVRYAERQEQDISGTRVRQAVVRTFLTRDPAIFIPEALERTVIPCPSAQ